MDSKPKRNHSCKYKKHACQDKFETIFTIDKTLPIKGFLNTKKTVSEQSSFRLNTPPYCAIK